jgi:hypothetical protein
MNTIQYVSEYNRPVTTAKRLEVTAARRLKICCLESGFLRIRNVSNDAEEAKTAITHSTLNTKTNMT